MFYWGLKHNGQILSVILNNDKPHISSFNCGFAITGDIVRIDVRIPDSWYKADHHNTWVNELELIDEYGHTHIKKWWGLRHDNNVCALLLSAKKPAIEAFGVNISEGRFDVVSIQIKEAGDYGDNNWTVVHD